MPLYIQHFLIRIYIKQSNKYDYMLTLLPVLLVLLDIHKLTPYTSTLKLN
jgi:hypothetical protein